MLKKISLRILQYLLEKYLWNKAEEYVKRTENNYDDIALANAKLLINDLLEEAKQ